MTVYAFEWVFALTHAKVGSFLSTKYFQKHLLSKWSRKFDCLLKNRLKNSNNFKIETAVPFTVKGHDSESAQEKTSFVPLTSEKQELYREKWK